MEVDYGQGGMFSENMAMEIDKKCPNCGVIHDGDRQYCSRRCWEEDSNE